jgi:hypothetical protein
MRIKLTFAVCLAGAVVFSSAAVAETPAPSASGHFAPYPGGVTPLTRSATITAGSCKYQQQVDNAHISSTAPRATSVHGSWLHIGGTCPTTSNVDTYLQAYWCDEFGCRWITVASDSGNVRAGGGSGKWITARKECSSSSKTVGWRGYVDVDLNGVSDPSGYTYSPPQNLTCVP